MIKIDEKKVTSLALQLHNKRLTKEEKEEKVALPRIQYLKDFHSRAINGGALSFIEAKCLIRETLTFDMYKIVYYEMIQFPQVRFFETEAEATLYFDTVTQCGRTPRGSRLSAQRMEFYGPKDRLYGDRKVISTWKTPTYTPDPMSYGYG